MCQHIIQFCTGSTKPLLFAGALLSFLLALSLGYNGCSSNALYQDIDSRVAQNVSLTYHLQIAAAIYLILLALFTCLAAHYDQKHSIRALALVTTFNFVLALVAILMIPNGIDNLFAARLKQAQAIYDYTENFPTPVNQSSSLDEAKLRSVRTLSNEVSASLPVTIDIREELTNKTEATLLWDKLQLRGCCGFKNYTEWSVTLPKSCCAEPIKQNSSNACKEVDSAHKRPCIELIGAPNFYLLILSAAVALVNLYLSTITGVSAYRTFNYNEASQSAYS